MDRDHEPLGSVLRDRELEAGASAHFDDPVYYSQAYKKRTADVAYYRRIAEDRLLEYGIGNGRIAIPLAKDGVEVTGIDRSAAMLADLRRRAERAGVRITAKRGDMRKVKLGRRFPLVICPFNAALHLYERKDVEAWLARVREHLLPKGELVLDVNMPIVEDLADPPGTSYAMGDVTHPTLGRVRYHEVFDYDRVRQISFCSMCFGDALVIPLAHRVFFPQELEALLHYNGFETTALYGDFDRGPLKQDSDVMIFHARRR